MNQIFSAVPPVIFSSGLITDGWQLAESILHVPVPPGAGLDIDPRIFAQGMEDREGFKAVI